jgi:Fe2+ transport system protein FeoA
MEKCIKDLKKGESGTIVRVLADNLALEKRYQELGLINGQVVTVQHIAPAKSAYIICVRGYLLALDKDICAKVVVEC